MASGIDWGCAWDYWLCTWPGPFAVKKQAWIGQLRSEVCQSHAAEALTAVVWEPDLWASNAQETRDRFGTQAGGMIVIMMMTACNFSLSYTPHALIDRAAVTQDNEIFCTCIGGCRSIVKLSTKTHRHACICSR